MYFLTPTTNHLRRLLINRGASIGSIQQTLGDNGESAYLLKEELKRERACLVASIWPDPVTLFDLLANFRLLRDNRCPSPSLIIPYLAYTAEANEPGQARLNEMIAELVRNLNPAHIYVFGLANSNLLQILGPNARHIDLWPLLVERLPKENAPEVVLAANEGAKPAASRVIQLLGGTADLAVCETLGTKNSPTGLRQLLGEVKGRRVLIVQTAIETGVSAGEAARLASQKGASQISLAAEHGIFCDQTRDKLARLPIKEIFVTNTWPQPRQANLKAADISNLIIELP